MGHPGVERSSLLTWGTFVGGLGAIPASSRPASQTGAGERREDPLTQLQTPTPPRPTRPASAPQILLPREGWRSVSAPRGPTVAPSSKLKAHRIQDTLLWPRPVPRPRLDGGRGRMEVVLGPAYSDPCRLVSRFCDLRPSQGLERLLPLPLPLQAQSSPIGICGGAAQSGLGRPHRGWTMAATAKQSRKCACARGALLPQPRFPVSSGTTLPRDLRAWEDTEQASFWRQRWSSL